MTKAITINKIEKAVKRKTKPLGKPSYISPCTIADIKYWYKRNILIFSGLIASFSLGIYALLIRQDHQDRFLHVQNFFSDTYSIVNLMDDFTAELMLLIFLLVCIRNLFAWCAIRIVGEKGFAFVLVNRNGAVMGVNILFFEQVKKLTFTQPRGGIGLILKWHGIHWSDYFEYSYHPFFENTKFVNAVLENWHRYKILRDHHLEMDIKRELKRNKP